MQWRRKNIHRAGWYTHIMVYKGHLYKGHSPLFKNDKGQGIGSSKTFGTVFAYDIIARDKVLKVKGS